jgi:hypothetical protein
MSTRKNFRLMPVPPSDLKIGNAYSAFHFTDPSKNTEGFFGGRENGIPIIAGAKKVLASEKEYAFYPISTSRKLLKVFGIDISALNRNFPARNADFHAVPDFKRTLKSSRQSRKRVRRG